MSAPAHLLVPDTATETADSNLLQDSTLAQALAFDDVLIEPAYSDVPPTAAQVETRITREINLNIPLVSAAMDTVTESRLAIVMAQLGGLGVIHKNMSVRTQADEVRKVKRFQSGMVVDPITITAERSVSDAIELMRKHKISGIPVVAHRSQRLLGILTNRDVRFLESDQKPVREVMTRRGLIKVQPDCSLKEARQLLNLHKLERLLVVDGQERCVGLITVKDIESAQAHPLATKDEQGRLRVAAAVGTGEKEAERAQVLCAANVDILVVDTAHGHSLAVISQVQRLQSLRLGVPIIAGNVATPEGALALIEAGADAVKVGIGPGSICTTRIVSGVGVPQLAAVQESARVCAAANIPVIADGGLRFAGDLAKAIAAGADCAMIGSLLAGTDEAPGEVFFAQGRAYKSYRGMGSAVAMARGSADRYFQQEVAQSQKFIAEGVEARVPYRGPVAYALAQLVGGLRAAMGYTGNRTIGEMKTRCRFRRITSAGVIESHPHDVILSENNSVSDR